MPMRWVRAHIYAMSTIQAGEALRSAEIIAVGSGKLKKGSVDAIVGRWRSEAGITRAIRPKTRQDLVNALRGMGVG